MRTTSSRDNWERLVAAVIKRDQIWQLCHQDSITTIHSSETSQQILSYSSNSLRPSPQIPPTNIQVRKNASGPITQKLFSAFLGRRKPKYDKLDEDLVDIPDDVAVHLRERHWRISLRGLHFATDKFSDTNILGRGRYSTVYKGRLPDRSLVAVKRLAAKPQVIGKELEISSIVQHPNVLRLRSFCFTEKERLLVFPFMVNGSVASWLRGRPETQPPLDWATRRRIAVGAAKGLAYLNYECHRQIIHCDVKAANILLDENFEAVVADFNLAEFFTDSYDGNARTGIRGTLGHIAPEYFYGGKCSAKADVFSYGVFLLELITAQKSYDLARASYDEVMLVVGVRGSYQMGQWKMMIDIELQSNFVDEEMEELLQIALICTQTDPVVRPTMPEVVKMLECGGDGFAERWRQYFFQNEFENEYLSMVHHQNTNTEWIIQDSTWNIREDELSGPR